MKTAIALRHLHFEHIGLIDRQLQQSGFAIDHLDIGIDPLSDVDPCAADLVIALGGPIAVYDESKYPFIEQEVALLRARMAAQRPTLGICLGAQMMAAALGARVYPTGVKEIGWSELSLTEAGRNSPLRHLLDVPVLHWHGDTFELPAGSNLLASTSQCPNQAFAIGTRILGLQFHGEVEVAEFERWLIGHACEIETAGLDVTRLRADSIAFGKDVKAAGEKLFQEWLAALC